MIWFTLTIVSVALWGLADMISKKGTELEDAFSHIKFVICTGIAMLVFLPFFRIFSESGDTILQLLAEYPAFFLITLAYVISLLFSFFSFRYMEGSINAPLCNTSAAMIFIMLLIFYLITGRGDDIKELLAPIDVIASILVCIGVVAIGIARSGDENSESETELGIKDSIKLYGAAAIIFPLLSAFFDALESVGDSIMVDSEAGVGIGSIDYMRLWAVTYVIVCIPLWIYLSVKQKTPYTPFVKREIIKLESGFTEVAAYVLYIVALEEEPFFVSFLSSTYCVFSIIFCHIFLKEKLSRAQYISINIIIVGLALFGISEGYQSM